MNPITRKEMFLAAAGGQDVTTPTPITREEVFLNEIAKGGGGSSLPSTETASVGDVLSLNDNKEPKWAAPGGSGGGVLVVHASDDDTPVLDKTWQEIKDAFDGGSVVITVTADNDIAYLAAVPGQLGEGFLVLFKIPSSADMNGYVASSANGYPAQVFE